MGGSCVREGDANGPHLITRLAALSHSLKTPVMCTGGNESDCPQKVVEKLILKINARLLPHFSVFRHLIDSIKATQFVA